MIPTVVERFAQAHKQIDQCAQAEREVLLALSHLRTATFLYEQGGKQPLAESLRTTSVALRHEVRS